MAKVRNIKKPTAARSSKRGVSSYADVMLLVNRPDKCRRIRHPERILLDQWVA